MEVKKCEKTEVNTMRLELFADGAAFEAAVNKAFLKNRNRYNVPGFRKGKATRGMIEKFYGEGAFYEDALDIIFPDMYEEAVKETKIDAVSSPFDFDVPQMGKDGVTIAFNVTVKPEVEVKLYKGIKAPKSEVSVSADEVKEAIDHALDENSRTVTIEDRAAKDGDTVVIDFEGFDDGVAFDGGKSENYSLVLGSNSFVPGFEEQLVGHNTGDEFDINVTFPEDYDKKLAGKPVVFKIKLHEIKEKQVPALDDDFVKDTSEFDTVADYKKNVEKDLLAKKQEEADGEFERAVLDVLRDNTVAEIPPVMVEKMIDEYVEDFGNRLSMQRLDMDTYLKYMGMDIATLREQYKETAEKHVRLTLALEKVCELESITATEDEVNEEVKKLAEYYGMAEEKIKEYVSVDTLEGDIIRRKSAEFVKNAAVAEKPAKKAAKKTADADDGEKKPAAKKTTKKADAAPADDAEKPAKKPAAKKPAKKADAAPAEDAEKPAKKPAAKKPAAKKKADAE